MDQTKNARPSTSDHDIVQRSVYANEFDKHAAYWLSCLPLQIDFIDDRSIKDVTGNDVRRFTQCHFFAGIGGWPLALEIAKWPADVPVWTGSCPCQPFSAAGKRKGVEDDRHLWPEFRRLIDECRPTTIFGEQVASKDGRNWLSVVRTDLEALGYAVGAADLCAAGVGAPHIRQRLFWVAHSNSRRLEEHSQCHGHQIQPQQQASLGRNTNGRSDTSGMANTGCERGDSRSGSWRRLDTQKRSEPSVNDQSDSRMGDTISDNMGRHRRSPLGAKEKSDCQRQVYGVGGQQSRFASPTCWRDAELVPCRDGKARPVKPGVRLLAHGIPGRVAQLRGLGNAIVPQVAAEFVAAVMDSIR
jgi:DNA (cytosine-5)-methyltransferase 1